ncbi:MAG: metal ABC transporter permease [Clostridia bacterium]|nr:metal ABC transporter permease [Clostridia bacterium]
MPSLTLWDIISSPVTLRAYAVGALVSLCLAVMGVILVLKRYAMIGHGLGEIGFASTALAALIGLQGYSLVISIPLVCLTSILIMYFDRKSNMGGDVFIGIFSTTALAVGVILGRFSSGYSVESGLFGSILGVSRGYMISVIVLCALILACFALLYTRLFSVTFDETYARATEVRTDLMQFIISLLTSVAVVLGMRVLGAMMISSFIIFPALTARRVAASFRGMILASALSAFISFTAGMGLSILSQLGTHPLPVGACVVLCSLALMLLSMALPQRTRKRQ